MTLDRLSIHTVPDLDPPDRFLCLVSLWSGLVTLSVLPGLGRESVSSSISECGLVLGSDGVPG